MSRITLSVDPSLKSAAVKAASRQGISLSPWLIETLESRVISQDGDRLSEIQFARYVEAFSELTGSGMPKFEAHEKALQIVQ